MLSRTNTAYGVSLYYDLFLILYQVLNILIECDSHDLGPLTLTIYKELQRGV